MSMGLRIALAVSAAAVAGPVAAGPRVITISDGIARDVTQAAFNPRAGDLVDSDPVIRQWALTRYDTNRDGWLTLYEAQPAATAFRDIADENRDGDVSVREYRAAIDFLRSRYR